MASGVTATGALTVGGADEYASPIALGGTTGPRDFARMVKVSRNGALAVRSQASDLAPNIPDRSLAGQT